MNIKKQITKFLSVLLSFSMAFSSVLPVYATEVIITEGTLGEIEQIEDDGEELMMLNDAMEVQADNESRYEEIEVNYSQSSSYFVTIPKTITLGADKRSSYSVKVEGDIVANKQVCVVPVDSIADTEVFDFYMKDQIAGSTKKDVVAEVSQAKFYWNHEEAAAGYEEQDNYIIADGLSAGRWKGTFQMEISMRTDPSHIHNYVGEITKEPTCSEPGEKIYTCDCGENYTEPIDPTGHHFENGECTGCGEKDPSHEHNYKEEITKQPTCIEEGEKTYTCDCGDSYTEKIPAAGHHYGDDDKCTGCGELNPEHIHNYEGGICTICGDKHLHSYEDGICTECHEKCDHNWEDGTCIICGKVDQYAIDSSGTYNEWDYTLNVEDKTITLNYYKGSKANVIVYANYVIDGITYKTLLKSNPSSVKTKYMFAASGTNSDPNKTMSTITFSDSLDTSTCINMANMFYGCNKLTNIEFGDSFDTRNVTNMIGMFSNCRSLVSLDVSKFDTSSVTNMASMFSNCKLLAELDLSNFNTSSVTDMSTMFYCCESLTSLDVSNFDTRNVTTMNNMFHTCCLLETLDLKSFDINTVMDMEYMFGSTRLTVIYVSKENWVIANGCKTNGMFNNCSISSVTYV